MTFYRHLDSELTIVKFIFRLPFARGRDGGEHWQVNVAASTAGTERSTIIILP